MDPTAIYQELLNHFGNEVILGLTEAQELIRDPFITVAGPKIDKVCLYCRVEPDLQMNFCQSITGMDTGDTITCVYHLFSYPLKHTLILKAATPKENPQLPSCTPAWPAADWYEREVFDLFGVHFTDHPNLRRLLLPEDWDGHPMLKDWVEKPLYRHIPTTRKNPLDLLD